MSSAELRQGVLKSLLLVSMAGFFLLPAISALVAVGGGGPPIHWTGIIAGWISCVAVLLVMGAWNRRRRGRRLLDCGKPPYRWNYFVWAAYGLGVGAAFSAIWAVVLAVLFAVCALLFSRAGFGIYERGIWLYWDLLPWDAISGYSWQDDSTLLVRLTGRPPWLNSEIPIPCELHDEVSQLLDVFLPDLEREASVLGEEVLTQRR